MAKRTVENWLSAPSTPRPVSIALNIATGLFFLVLAIAFVAS